jgi:hypothetical protein
MERLAEAATPLVGADLGPEDAEHAVAADEAASALEGEEDEEREAAGLADDGADGLAGGVPQVGRAQCREPNHGHPWALICEVRAGEPVVIMLLPAPSGKAALERRSVLTGRIDGPI